MLRLRTPFAAGALLTMICIGAAPAKANTIPVTYVSGKGTDSGNCSSPANPCRTFWVDRPVHTTSEKYIETWLKMPARTRGSWAAAMNATHEPRLVPRIPTRSCPCCMSQSTQARVSMIDCRQAWTVRPTLLDTW